MKITRKRYLALLLALLLSFSALLTPAVLAAPAPEADGEDAPAPTAKPEVKSEILASVERPECKWAVLMDAESGDVLYEYHDPSEASAYPASITKVMTALLVLEAVDRGELGLNQMITASDTFGYDLEAGGRTQSIQPGEQMSVLDLLYCMLLSSANDAANILAETVGGSVPDFVALMNERAGELGMADTKFTNAHGLHSAGHYTTAYDLALLVRQAVQNDTFVTIVSATSHEVLPTNLTEKSRSLSSSNALINHRLYNGAYSYTKAIGVNAGSTNAAGFCVAAAAEDKGETLICVVLGAEEVKNEKGAVVDRKQFSESKRLLQWGFSNFQRKALVSNNPVAEIPVELSADTTAVAVKPGRIPEVMLPKDMDPADFQRDITLHYETLEAPVEAGQVVGELTVRNGDSVYATVPLVAAASAQQSPFLGGVRAVQNFFGQTWVKVALVALVVLIVVCIVRFSMFKPRKGYHGKSRRQSRNRRRR